MTRAVARVEAERTQRASPATTGEGPAPRKTSASPASAPDAFTGVPHNTVPAPDTPAGERPSAASASGLLAAGLAGLLMESSGWAARGAESLEESVRQFADAAVGARIPGARRARQTLALEAERMEARGRAEIDRLASLGRAEEQRLAATSEMVFREMAADVVDDVLELSIERLAESPKIHRMIRQESSTLLDDLLDGVRLWCAGADNWVERGARRVFRRGRSRPAHDPDASEPDAPPFAGPSGGPAPVYNEPAGFVSRAVALILDAVVVTGAAAAGGYLITVTLQALRPGIPGHYLLILPSGLFGALFMVYFVFSWAAPGRTIGMGVLGLKVQTLGGGRVSFLRALLRYAGYLLSTAFVFVGFLWVMIDNRRLGWLDHIARTTVVRTELPGERRFL